MKKLPACLAMVLLAHLAAGCSTTYDGSEKAYGMHPEWTDRQPQYLPADQKGDAPEDASP